MRKEFENVPCQEAKPQYPQFLIFKNACDFGGTHLVSFEHLGCELPMAGTERALLE